MIHVPTPAMIAEDRTECVAWKSVACAVSEREIPVAYQEVTLTDEAAEILEGQRKAAAERPTRKIRRVALAR